jgi:hypothetical protein
MLWSRILCIVGIAVIAICAVAYVARTTLPGFDEWVLAHFGLPATRAASWFIHGPTLLFLLFPASGLVALGAFLARSRYRRFLYGAFGLTACGLIAAFLLLGYLEAPALPWFAYVAWAYPIGGIMTAVGAVVVIFESSRRAPVPKNDVGTA